jgi:hypothetical protein
MPESHVYVCDDSRRPYRYEGATNVPATAYDIGLSAKRNLLVDATDESYIMLHDDDYVMMEETDLSVLWDLLHAFDDVGIVCAERAEKRGKDWHAKGWFTGRLWPQGSLRYHRPPEGRYDTVTVKGRTLRYHRVDFGMNWFLADRETLELVPFDEELKLQEHAEFFARLAAVRAEHDPDERSAKWRERYQEREYGAPQKLEPDSEGKVMVYARRSFSNRKHLSHLPGSMAHRGNWYRIDYEYAKDLLDMGHVASPVEMHDARPFPLPSNAGPSEDGHVPCGVLLALDTICVHDPQGSPTYNGMRRRDEFWSLKHQKLGTNERDMVQWNDYPYGEIGPVTVKDQHLALPELNEERYVY